MGRSISRLAGLAVLFTSAVFANKAVYLNTTTDTGNTLTYASFGYTQLGDQISLAGTDRLAVLAIAQLFNSGTAGTVDLTLRLFDLGAPVGTQIGPDFVRTAVTVPGVDDPEGGVFNVNFNLPNVLVPDNLIFTLSFANASAGVDLGVNMFEPPTVGTSDNTLAIGNDGTSFVTINTLNENVFFELDATSLPEPGTAALALTALAMLWRKRRTS